jgi:glutamate-1-semialdehyde 2,1-aminomutase
MARLLRQRLSALFQNRGCNWVVYGEFSGFKFLPDYQGPPPANDDFTPYDGSLEKLDGSKNPRLIHAFRRALLLGGVDLPGMGGMTTAAHTEADIEQTVAAVAAALELLEKDRVTA